MLIHTGVLAARCSRCSSGWKIARPLRLLKARGHSLTEAGEVLGIPRIEDLRVSLQGATRDQRIVCRATRGIQKCVHHEELRVTPRARSSLIATSKRSVSPAGIFRSLRKTQTPSSLREAELERSGRSVTRSPSDSKASVSPGASPNSSRNGFGRTTRPALSAVTVVFMDVIYKWHLPFVNAINAPKPAKELLGRRRVAARLHIASHHP